MAQTLVRFDTPVIHRDGTQYKAQACGHERENGQPNEKDTAYWATGLTPVYLEGALDRILNPPKFRDVELAPPPFFDGPAPKPRRRTVMSNRDPIR